MYAGRSAGSMATTALSSRPLIDAKEVILAPPSEFQHIGVVTPSGVVKVRVSNGDQPLDPLVIVVLTERVQRVRIETNRHPRFGVGNDLVGQFVDADVAVVSELRPEPGSHALKQGPAWVGGELAPTDPTHRNRLKIRPAAEIAVGIRNAAVREGELVQHGQPIEPVIVRPLAHLELRGSSPHQGSGEPGWDRASDRQVVQARFLIQSTEPQVIW